MLLVSIQQLMEGCCMRKVSRRTFMTVTAAGAAAAYASAACATGEGEPTVVSQAPGGTPEPGALATVDAGADNGAVGLRWFGQSMFLLTSAGGTTILLDPFNDIGYTLPAPITADAATITHEHPDHNNDALAAAPAARELRILRGLTADGWADLDETVSDVRIITVRAYHDAEQGARLGRNAIFVFEAAGLRIAHLGDLGHALDAAQLAALGAVDVLMVPTGGNFSIGAEVATQVTAQIAPKMVFPMHYQTAKAAFLKETADPFLAGKTVERVGSTDIRIARADLPPELTAYVLDYE
jgi:L-ascorbate metabolism protein UlaG (beta-lactamase superfamily)